MDNDQIDIFTFVIMPFRSEFNDVYQLAIKEAAKACGVRAERLDEQLFGEGMLERIYRQIDVADFIIADLSERNPNVFYELGFAHAKNKICILLTKTAADIPFDLKHKRHIVYGNSIGYLKEEITKNILWAKAQARSRFDNKISVITKQPTGDLSTSKYAAKATVIFTFDLHNKTNQMSPEVSAIYLYTGNQWEITHDTKRCPHSEADIKPFKYRYFIAPPVQRIGRNGWTQVKVKATRTIANVWDGDQIKEQYHIGGRGILRLETQDGNYDHEFDFNLEIEEIPF